MVEPLCAECQNIALMAKVASDLDFSAPRITVLCLSPKKSRGFSTHSAPMPAGLVNQGGERQVPMLEGTLLTPWDLGLSELRFTRPGRLRSRDPVGGLCYARVTLS